MNRWNMRLSLRVFSALIGALFAGLAGCGGFGGGGGDDGGIRPYNTPPTIIIRSPSDGQTVEQGQAVTFKAVAGDTEDAPPELRVEWSSSIDGVLLSTFDTPSETCPDLSGECTFYLNTLSVGEHLITVRVLDTGVYSASDQVSLTVTERNDAPSCEISAPEQDAVFTEGEAVSFTGVVDDPNGDVISLRATWASDIDGSLGAARSPDPSGNVGITSSDDADPPGLDRVRLSTGRHTITLHVEDEGGLTGYCTRFITILSTDAAPTASLTSPADGSVYVQGQAVHFVGRVGDDRDAPEALGVQWASDLDGILGSDPSDSAGNVNLVVSDLSVGLHTVTLTATDASGSATSDSTLVMIQAPNTAPTARITGVAPGAQVLEGTTVIVSGLVSDAEDSPLSLAVRWTSSLQGELNGGSEPEADGSVTLSTAGLIVGTHTLTLRVEDTDGLRHSASTLMTVRGANSAPEAHITGPAEGTYVQGATLLFMAQVGDVEDGPAALDLTWSTDLDGELPDTPPADDAGQVSFAYGGLSVGTHVLSLVARDSGGAAASDLRMITIRAPNQPPQVAFTGPEDTFFDLGETVFFTATITDDADPAPFLTVLLTSDRDGLLCEGAVPDSAGSFECSSSGLSEGTHLITLRVTDLDGASTARTLTLNVEAENRAPTVTLQAPVDGAVFVAGTPIAFRAQATDPEDLEADLVVEWSSDRDGVFNTAPPDDAGSMVFTYSGLSVGTHEVTLKVTDGALAYSVANVVFSVRQPNAHPTAAITSPASDGDVFLAGAPIAFKGVVADADDDLTDLAIRWTSDRDGELNTTAPDSTGAVQFTAANLSVGTHLISLRVADTGGLVAVASRVLTVRSPNVAPTATITEPDDGLVATVGDVITFEGLIGDTETAVTSLGVSWRSDRDGEFNTTAADAGGNLGFTYDGLSVGVHLITLAVTDGDGASSSDSVTVTVLGENTPPTAEITAPAGGATYLSGAQVVFQGVVADADQGAPSLDVTWTSDRDGLLHDVAPDSSGATTFATGGLSVGTHLVTLRVEDSSGAVAIDTVSVTIRAANRPPTATLIAPDGGTYVEGSILTFSGTISDVEDSPLALSVEWRSSLLTDAFNTDPADAAGNLAFTFAGLPLGTQLITLKVTDSEGLTSTDSTTVVVRRANALPTITITQPAGDVAVFQGTPVTFSATAADTEDVATALGISWRSDISGVLSTQAPNSSGITQFTKADLAVGTHFITVTATDSDGGVASASVTVTVRTTNSVPQVEITAPAATTFFQGQTITFKGTAVDAEDAETALAIEWRSSLDGILSAAGADAAGNVVLATAGLSVGTHIITLKATDTDGAAATDTLTVVVRASNQLPAVEITSPTDGVSVTQGQSVAFQATVSDVEDAATALTLSWRSDLSGELNTDPANVSGVAAFNTAALPVGTHIVTLRVTDRDGGVGTDTVTVTVVGANRPPTASLTAPVDGTTVLVGTPITFRGTVSDPEDAAATLAVTFTSDKDGQFQAPTPDAAGAVVFSYASLSVGTHFISMRVQDGDGAAATDGITLTIRAANTPPTATITTPADGSSAFVGATVVFTGTATDAEDASPLLSAAWSSNLDGALGSATPDSSGNVSLSTSALRVGQHTITLTVTDTEGGTDTDVILLSVRSPNVAPSAQITQPTTGATVFAGVNVVFRGTVSDPEDAEDALSIRWSSDRDGQLSTAAADSSGVATFSTASLSVGQHLITLRVTDLDGATANATVSLTVRAPNVAPTVEITGPAVTTYTRGATITFNATATDPEDAANLLSYEFVSNLQGSLATGSVTAAGTVTFATTALNTGVHTVTLRVTDRDGGVGTDQIQITVNAPNVAPTATLTAPATGITVNTGASVLFQGTGTDPEDLETALTWTLTSSLDGQFGAGNPGASGNFSFSYSSLSVGTHTITLTVTDTAGDSDTDAITITVVVPNQAPAITISAPVQSATYEAGQAVPFSATVTDADDAVTSLTVTWVSDRDGTLNVGPPNGSGISAFTDATLSIGTHVVTATVQDPSGATAVKNVTVVITAANTPPTVAITSPADGASVTTGQSVLFRGTATDVESPETALTILWSSVPDGSLNTTAPDSSGNVSFSTATLSVGTHTITLKATDPQGAFATASISLTVRQANRPPTQPGVAITPASPRTADALLAVITADSTDPDGDLVSYAYQWYKNGTAQAGLTTDTLVSSLTAKNDVWKVRVTPTDGSANGPFAEASKTISNTAPSVSTVTLTPTTAVEGSTLTVSVNGYSDPDSDPAANIIDWFVGGSLVATGVTTLDGDDFNKGDVVLVRVTPGDGTDSGTPVNSNPVTIGNTVPSAPEVAITPTDPNQGENLVCSVVTASVDVDADTVTYRYDWYLDGSFFVSSSSTATANTLPSADTALGDDWECVVTPGDGDGSGPSDSASVDVLPDAGDLVITELMINPGAVTDDRGEYVEIYNATSLAIPLDGFRLTDGATDNHTISSSGTLVVDAGSRVVLGRDERSGVNGGLVVDYEYNNFVLSDSNDTVSIFYGSRRIDTTSYTSGQVASGRSLTLDPGANTAVGNDDPLNWCLATSFQLGAGDFGSPGASNEPCACDDSDSDGDAFGDDAQCTFLDCNDASVLFNPVAVDICEDGLDQNCDGSDETCDCLSTDGDGDGYGTGAACVQVDCDDTNAAINPGRAEVCNGVNDDCDGSIDEGFDNDGDTYLTCSVGGRPVDCDDTNPARYPGNTEICDDYDNDCDTTINEGFDLDGDNNYACTFMGRAADCDDTNPARYQGNTEVCDAYDNDCDNTINEGLGDNWEGNNTLGTASTIGNIDDQFYTLSPAATIHSPDDSSDFYKFEVSDSFPNSPINDGFYITVTLSAIPAGTNYNLYLYKPGGSTPHLSGTNSGNANESFTFTGAGGTNDGGTWTVEVRRASGFSCATYKLDIDNDD